VGGDVDVADDGAIAQPGQVLAAVGVVGLAVGLAVLPMLVALGFATGAVAGAAVGLGSLAAIWRGVEAAALILGAAGYVRRSRERVFAVLGD
jgi:hypothetical protein